MKAMVAKQHKMMYHYFLFKMKLFDFFKKSLMIFWLKKKKLYSEVFF